MNATETAPGTTSERLTLSQAAGLANKSANTITNWVARGTLPAVRILGRLYVERADLEKLMEAVPVQATGAKT